MSDEEVFLQSRLVPVEEIEGSGCFTTLPVRMAKRVDLADAATHRLVNDWAKYVGDGWEKKSLISLNERGNLCALIYPESFPERLGLLTYLTDMGLIHDDACEEMDVEEAIAEHDDLDAAMDINDKRVLEEGSKSMKMKKLLSQSLIESISLDRELGIQMLETYRKLWLAVMEHPNTAEFQTMEAYLNFRRLNIGMRAFWPMVQFSMGIMITDEDAAFVKDVFAPAEDALMLTNDYWSWEREYEASKQMGAGRLVNAVELLMRTKGMSDKEGHKSLKNMIIDLEQEYLRRKTQFYIDHPDLPLYLRRWIECCGLIVAGNHYWCSACPRHNAWREQAGVAAAIDKQMAQLAKQERLAEAASSNGSSEPKSNGTSITSADSTPPRSEKAEKIPKVNGTKTTGLPVRDTKTRTKSDDAWYKPDDTVISAPCKYIASLPSKGVRSMLMENLNGWLHVPKESLVVIDNVVGLLHNASLILDDIEDNSPKRRGQVAAHGIFGHAQSINSANFMYVQAVQAIRKLDNPTTTTVLLEELECLYLGQSWDLYWKYNLVCPTEAEYLNMVDNKTGGMFRMLLRLMQAESPLISTFDFDRLTFLFGRFFQIRDDYMNLASGEYTDQKGFCEDLDEGKFSYPIVQCIQNHPEYKDSILGVFRQRPSMLESGAVPLSYESKIHIISCLEKAGSLRATLEHLKDMEKELSAEIKKLETTTGESNPMLHLLLIKLSVQDMQAEDRLIGKKTG
jgi:geranylgeranyl pyrophosphate synthase